MCNLERMYVLLVSNTNTHPISHRFQIIARSITAVAAPAQQRSHQVISRSEHPRAKSPGCTFSSKKLTTFFSRRPQNTGRNRQGGARAVDLPARSFDLAQPGVAPPLYC